MNYILSYSHRIWKGTNMCHVYKWARVQDHQIPIGATCFPVFPAHLETGTIHLFSIEGNKETLLIIQGDSTVRTLTDKEVEMYERQQSSNGE